MRICEKIYFPYTGEPNRYYLKPLQSTNKEVVQGYDGLFNNCVQVSMDVLLKGEFDSNSTIYKEIILEAQSYPMPNIVYMNLIDVHGGDGRSF